MIPFKRDIPKRMMKIALKIAFKRMKKEILSLPKEEMKWFNMRLDEK
jgi:hypothetical protein